MQYKVFESFVRFLSPFYNESQQSHNEFPFPLFRGNLQKMVRLIERVTPRLILVYFMMFRELRR